MGGGVFSDSEFELNRESRGGIPSCSALAQPADEAGPPRTPWGVPDLQGT